METELEGASQAVILEVFKARQTVIWSGLDRGDIGLGDLLRFLLVFFSCDSVVIAMAGSRVGKNAQVILGPCKHAIYIKEEKSPCQFDLGGNYFLILYLLAGLTVGR